jgi:hypothetical protein
MNTDHGESKVKGAGGGVPKRAQKKKGKREEQHKV